MSFQGNAFQGDGFQTGSPLLYPWAPTTGSSYFDGLPDRIRTVIYQGLAAAPTFTQQAVATTPTTSGLQDFDYRFRKPFRPPQFSDFVTIEGIRATTPVTAGLQDLDTSSRKKHLQQQYSMFVTTDGIRIATAGLQDLDTSSRKRYLHHDPTTLGINTNVAAQTPITAGLQDFDYNFRKPFKPPQFSDFITIDGVRSTTPVTAGLQDLDRYIWAKPFRPPQFNDFVTPDGIRATTPITSGLKDLDISSRKKYLHHEYSAFPQNRDTAAQTPITAGLQDLDVAFKKPFRPPQFTDFVTISGIQATTPITAGLQDLDRYIWAKPFRPPQFNDFVTISGIQATTPITAGLQDFERVPQRKPFAPDLPFTAPPTQLVVQATAGLQGLDIQFIRPSKVWLQQVTTFAPTVIVIAVTPSDFQFAVAGLPPFRYGMNVKLQEFCAMCMGQDLTPPPVVVVDKFFPFIANVGSLMQRS